MQITAFSVFMAVLWSSILILLQYFCRKNIRFIRWFGVGSLLILCTFSAVRMLFPYEFFFTKAIPLEGVFNVFWEWFYINKIGTTRWSLLSVFVCLWIGGAILLCLALAVRYVRVARWASSGRPCEDEQYSRVFRRVAHEGKRKMKIELRTRGDVKIPVGEGIFRKIIVLPERKYGDSELYHILKHEYTHFENRDLPVKLLTQLFCCVFWWNPAAYLLKKDLSQTLEIKCDLRVTEGMDDVGKAEYLTTIVSELKRAGAEESREKRDMTTAFSGSRRGMELVERLRIVADSRNHRSRKGLSLVLWVAATVLFMAFSYSFVLQPRYDPPVKEIETDPNTFELTKENSYLIKGADGTYYMVDNITGKKDEIPDFLAESLIFQGFTVIEEK